jgi:hypothetical protein
MTLDYCSAITTTSINAHEDGLGEKLKVLVNCGQCDFLNLARTGSSVLLLAR